MMDHWLKCPQRLQLWSRILNCNFSTVASCTSVKLSHEVLPPFVIRSDVLSVRKTMIEPNDQEKLSCRVLSGRVGSKYSVPFVFPRHFDHQRTVMCKAADVVSASGPGSDRQEKPRGKPTNEQLEIVYLKLSEDIPKLFFGAQDYSIYDPNIVFEDNIREKVTIGLQNYVINIGLLKIKSHLKYTHVKMVVLRITQHPEEGCVKIRWRIVGAPGFFKLFTSFWKFKPVTIFKSKTLSNEDAEWIDGFSIFYVNDQGKINRHVCEKMMPDDDKIVETKKSKINVAI